MKNIKQPFQYLLILLFAHTASSAICQIPNSGFEDWTTVGAYMVPSGWITPNPYSGSAFYPATRDTSNYPPGTGNYSIRLENKTAAIPDIESKGVAVTSDDFSFKPSFQVTGHPNSLTGYYKYDSQGGDSMWVAVALYQSGTMVSFGTFYSGTSAPDWTSFDVPLSAYTAADSGVIVISAFNANGPSTAPKGNSVLHIDNLNFDDLITGHEIGTSMAANLTLHPHPFSASATLQTDLAMKDATLTLSNACGLIVRQVDHLSGSTFTLNRDHLPSGLYLLQLTDGGRPFPPKKVVITE